jgi:hypothetical protein
MKKLILIAFILFPPCLHAQRAVQKNPDTGALLDGFNTGSETIEITSAGTLKFNSGFTLTGGGFLTSALGLVIGTDVQAYHANLAAIAAGTWTGAASMTTLGTITTGTWNGTTIAVANGGTGSTTAANARTALGLAIGTDVQAYHANLAAIAAGTWTGASSMTTLGTITTGTWNGTTIAVANGGTGSTTAANARTALGLAIGTDVQAYHANLAAIAAGTWTGASSMTTLGTITTGVWNGTAVAVANGGTGSTTATDARTALGLAIGTDVQAYHASLAAIAAGTWTGSTALTTLGTITTGTWNGTPVAVARGGTGGSTSATARTNLGVQPTDNPVFTGSFRAASSTSAASNGIAMGGTSVASGSNAVAIGSSSTASGSGSVVLGLSNTAAANSSSILGSNNTAGAGTGIDGTVVIGVQNTATPADNGICNVIIGASNTLANTVSASYTFTTGVFGNVRHSHERLHANNEFSGRQTQSGEVILTTTTTNATVTELAIDHTTATRFFTVGDGRAYDCLIRVIGRRSDGTQHAIYWRKVFIQRTGATTSLPTAIQTIGTDFESNAAWAVDVTADDTNDRLRIAVTGAAAVTIGWTAHIIFNELTY